ncbi:MAG: hypothetical protein K2N37_09815 [Lachnospiraceae bacterium]|nr:hypothetical protein [Lachnospiraceae bacterium]
MGELVKEMKPYSEIIRMTHTGIENIRKEIPMLPFAVYSSDIPPKPPHPCHNTSIKMPASRRVKKIKNRIMAIQRFFFIRDISG